MQLTSLLNAGLLIASAQAYTNNCEGSTYSPSITDCQAAIRNIHVDQAYVDQAQFSVGDCYLIYATNDSGDQTIGGQLLRDTAEAILDTCGHHKGSFGTNNCDECHVTMNYRSHRSFDA
ncbi:hypothetical protein BJX66DRAFT_320134 [Aspergillus keveii]|uniref:Uncharacterized protein n=1 Tax=Aspergillus keveii TaxID=714993 RepID=A0ABR4FHG3_9EURO